MADVQLFTPEKDVPYEDLTPKDQIASILKIPNNDGWIISDSRPEENLYLIHPSKEKKVEYGDLRGVVVDTKYKTVVARSYGYTPRVVRDELVLDQDGGIKMTDDLGTVIKLEKERFAIYAGYDGVFIRIFKSIGVSDAKAWIVKLSGIFAGELHNFTAIHRLTKTNAIFVGTAFVIDFNDGKQTQHFGNFACFSRKSAAFN